MNRRNFIRTAAASAAAASLPVDALAKAGSKACITDPDTIEMMARYHPMALLQRCGEILEPQGHPGSRRIDASSLYRRREDGDMIEVNASLTLYGWHRETEDRDMDAIASSLGLPRILRTLDHKLAGSWVRHVSIGQNVHAIFDEGSPNVYWRVGSKYIALYYDLPGSPGKFVFRAGLRDPETMSPRVDDKPVDGWGDAPWLHWKGAIVDAALEPEDKETVTDRYPKGQGTPEHALRRVSKTPNPIIES